MFQATIITKAIVKDRIVDIISKHIFFDKDKVGVQSKVYRGNIGFSTITSLIFINIVVELEQEFDFEFEDEYLDNKKIESIDAIVNYVYNRIK